MQYNKRCSKNVVIIQLSLLICMIITTPLILAILYNCILTLLVHFNTVFRSFKNKKEEECQMAIIYFAWRERKLRYYGGYIIIHSFDLKSAIEHDGGV